MKFRKTILIVGVIGLVQAKGLNDVLTEVFAPETETAVEKSTTPVSIGDPNIGFEDLTKLRAQIMKLETDEEFWRKKLADMQTEKLIYQDDATTQKGEIRLLETYLNRETKNLEKWEKNKKVYEARLVELTKQQVFQKAVLREKVKIFNTDIQTQTLYEQNQNRNHLGLWQWMIFPESVAQVQRQNWINDQKNTYKKSKLTQLQVEKQKLQHLTQSVAELHDMARKMEAKAQIAQKNVNEILIAKSNLLAQSEANLSETQANIRSAHQQISSITSDLRLLRSDPDRFVAQAETKQVATLQYPFDGTPRITANFRDPAYKSRFKREHLGLDMALPQGTPLLAPADGAVVKTTSNGLGYGYIAIDHGSDMFTVMGHVSGFIASVGDSVVAGDPVAFSGGLPGTTGAGYFTTGPHVHFEVLVDGVYRDPLDFLVE